MAGLEPFEGATAVCPRCFNPVRLSEAEYRESPAPTRREPDRTVAARLHRRCAELSDRAVEMARRLGPVGVTAGQEALA